MKNGFKLIRIHLRKNASAARAKISQSFFKTAPGQYGAGDKFIGVAVPTIRSIAKSYIQISEKDLKMLITSPIHEERLASILILVERYKKSQSIAQKYQIFLKYLAYKQGVNNWDLVDSSAYQILGDYCFLIKNIKKMDMLLKSKRHWDRRMAIVATYAFIKQGKTEVIYSYAKKVLADKEDLMHKATGWMLREAGKIDSSKLINFIEINVSRMPRTMLRYAIEKFPEKQRKMILAL